MFNVSVFKRNNFQNLQEFCKIVIDSIKIILSYHFKEMQTQLGKNNDGKKIKLLLVTFSVQLQFIFGKSDL